LRNAQKTLFPQDGSEKQLNKEVNRIQRELQNLPIHYGTVDPEGSIIADAGHIYLRTTKQGKNYEEATPHVYLKTSDGGKTGWLPLVMIGRGSPVGLVVAPQGSLLIDTVDGTLYKKASNTGSTAGWAAV